MSEDIAARLLRLGQWFKPSAPVGVKDAALGEILGISPDTVRKMRTHRLKAGKTLVLLLDQLEGKTPPAPTLTGL